MVIQICDLFLYSSMSIACWLFKILMEFNTNLFLTTTIVVTSGVLLKVCMEIKKKRSLQQCYM